MWLVRTGPTARRPGPGATKELAGGRVAQEYRQDHGWPAAGQLARGQLLVPDRGAADVAQLRPGCDPRGTAGTARARADHDQVVLLLARLHAGAGRHRRGHDRQVRRLPQPACRTGHEHGPDVHRRSHVGTELGSRLAGRPRPVLRRVDGRAAGLVRRGDGAPVRRAPRGSRLAGLQRDAAVRRRPGVARSRGRLGPDHQGRGARGRRPPAVLARRRRLGHRGDRPRQRIPARRCRLHLRLRRPARVPGRRRSDPAALRGGVAVRAGQHVRQAGGAGGVRGQLRFRVGGERGPLLPARPAQQPAGRGDRLDRVEQHRLRPARPGPVPAPRLRAALRPHRRGRPAQGHPARDAGVRGHAGRTSR